MSESLEILCQLGLVAVLKSPRHRSAPLIDVKS
jgi:hypothetical protein